MPKCLIAMSGGVDSSVAACLLQSQGYDCIGATMRLHDRAAARDFEDAQSVCRRLGIPHHILDFTEEFRQDVINPFVSEYASGRTPNPCVTCNRRIKFGRLWQAARDLGCDFLATGHYARILSDGRVHKAIDASKDQSYVLCFLTEETIRHTLFPLGSLSKQDVRKIAQEAGFVTAERPESQDICFIPDGDYGSFLEKYSGKFWPSGDFVDHDGHVLGKHCGLVRYTIGQRRGLGVASSSRLYVLGKDAEHNTVLLGQNEELFSTELTARQIRLCEEIPPEGLRLYAKVRYRMAEQPCLVYQTGSDEIRVVFDAPQRAITPGQTVALYDGDSVFGGGIIQKEKQAAV